MLLLLLLKPGPEIFVRLVSLDVLMYVYLAVSEALHHRPGSAVVLGYRMGVASGVCISMNERALPGINDVGM